MTSASTLLAPIVYRARTDITAKKMPSGASIWCRNEPLTVERIEDHVSGKQLRGVCPIKEGESTTQLLVLDLDSHKGETSLRDMVSTAQKIYDAFADIGIHFESFYSSGGRGVHMIAIWDDPQDAYSVRHLAADILDSIGFKNGTGGVAKGEVEIFPKQNSVPKGGCGNQFILPYSPKGQPISEPDWRLSKDVVFVPKPEYKKAETPLFDARPDINEAAQALDSVSPDDYFIWVKMGMALKDAFGDAGFAVWDSWSSRSEKYNAREMKRKWDSFRNEGVTIASLFDEAMLRGWKQEWVERVVNTGVVDGFIKQLNLQKNTSTEVLPTVVQCSFSFDALSVRGLIGDTVREMVKYAMYQQPELCLMNLIAAAGAVFGRRYASPSDIRTNIYMVGVARTAAGKDFSRQYISRLFEKAGLQDFLGAHYIRSDTGMLVNLQAKPSQIMMLDEFGMYLEAIGSQKAPMHIRNVSACLTKLFTSASSFYDHSSTADTKTEIKIQRPNACIYATTTEGAYAGALKRSAIESGELNRFLVFKSMRHFTGHESLPDPYKVSDELAERWGALSPQGLYSLPNIGNIPPEPKIVSWDSEIQDMLKDCRVKQQTILNQEMETSGLWGRFEELVTKVAMILSISEDVENPKFTIESVDLARSIVETCIEYMANIAVANVSDSEYETAQQRALKFLKEQKSPVPMSAFNGKLRSMKAKDRRDMLVDLVQQGIVSIDRIESSGGRPREMVSIVR